MLSSAMALTLAAKASPAAMADGTGTGRCASRPRRASYPTVGGPSGSAASGGPPTVG